MVQNEPAIDHADRQQKQSPAQVKLLLSQPGLPQKIAVGCQIDPLHDHGPKKPHGLPAVKNQKQGRIDQLHMEQPDLGAIDPVIR